MLFWERMKRVFKKFLSKKLQNGNNATARGFRPPLSADRSSDGSIEQIVSDQLLQKLVSVELADEAASVVVVCDIGRVFGEKIADDLVDGVVALFRQGTVDLGQSLLHFLGIIRRYGEFYGVVVQNVRLLCTFPLSYTKLQIK